MGLVPTGATRATILSGRDFAETHQGACRMTQRLATSFAARGAKNARHQQAVPGLSGRGHSNLLTRVRKDVTVAAAGRSARGLSSRGGGKENMSDAPLEPRRPEHEANAEDEVPTRVCPHCATVSHTAGEYCPQCGKPYSKKARLSKRARIALIAGLVIVLLGGAGAAIAIKNHQDEETRKKHEAALRVERERTEQAHREAEDEQRAKRESEERERRSDEKELEKAVEADAKKLVNEGTLSETILGASCSPVSGGSSTELNQPTGSYNCIAITKRESGGESSGYRFTGNIDFSHGSFTYHLGGP